MPHKQLFFRSEAREKILRGATALADAVRVTLGPKSKCVLIERKRGSRKIGVMKDLVPVLKHVVKAGRPLLIVAEDVAEGIVPGAGLALLRAITAVEGAEPQCEGDERTGLRILRHALEAPTRQIAENSAVDGGVVVDRMRNRSGELRLRRGPGDLRRPRGSGHHRPDQGGSGGTRERGIRGERPASHRGDPDRGPRAEEGTGRRAAGLVTRSLQPAGRRAVSDPAIEESLAELGQ